MARILIDGRQSETALEVQRGLVRFCFSRNVRCLTEFVLPDARRVDLIGLHADGTIWIVEIKSSLADLRADTKWPNYREYCDALYFATTPQNRELPFPQEAGLLVADAYGAECLCDAPQYKMSPARRKTLTLGFAREAASRLSGYLDPSLEAPTVT